jgi:hypothetical protein
MARRRRKHISATERLAAALACLLPADIRDMFREAEISAKSVINQFTFDHVKLHAWGGSDKWWNLDPRRRGPALEAKDAADTSRAAKARRIDEKWRPFTRAMAAGRKPPKRKSRWPSRPFR